MRKPDQMSKVFIMDRDAALQNALADVFPNSQANLEEVAKPSLTNLLLDWGTFSTTSINWWPEHTLYLHFKPWQSMRISKDGQRQERQAMKSSKQLPSAFELAEADSQERRILKEGNHQILGATKIQVVQKG
ncbi:hypothetical protein PSHT_04437 [Puccinia striiformis]|uniref:Uncharacterized protein n=1 Tax=Puccinia striiformis TaxID=27350 RepID=A0A2S4WCZ1_9BASI|nr:hypothetical protein PSHT_04437 [Puccinia striiformis]